MQIQLKGTNLDITDEIAEYAHEKVRMVEKFITPKDPSSMHAYVELEKTTDHHNAADDLYRAEVNLEVDGQHQRAEANAAEIFAAIDEVKDELERVVKSRKEKERTEGRKAGRFFKNLMRGFNRGE